MKTACVPVEFRVETILAAIFALLPMPVTTTLPVESSIISTHLTKSLFMPFLSPSIAAVSSTIVLRAICFISVGDFNANLLFNPAKIGRKAENGVLANQGLYQP
jgi:hypothetical protein